MAMELLAWRRIEDGVAAVAVVGVRVSAATWDS